jgi:hypothetical protein
LAFAEFNVHRGPPGGRSYQHYDRRRREFGYPTLSSRPNGGDT